MERMKARPEPWGDRNAGQQENREGKGQQQQESGINK
jgi:hypothetical protein